MILIFAAMTAGCSKKPAKVGAVSADNNGLRITLTSLPDPPQSGANTFTIKLTDSASGVPVVNANVTISAYNDLAGGGDRESGRSQGDGSYNVPIKLAIPDKYRLDVQVQRPGHDDSDVQFTVESE